MPLLTFGRGLAERSVAAGLSMRHTDGAGRTRELVTRPGTHAARAPAGVRHAAVLTHLGTAEIRAAQRAAASDTVHCNGTQREPELDQRT